MFETEITQNRFLLGYCQNLVNDLPDERLTEQPLPNVNHPAWILGHLSNTFDVVTGMLGGEKKLDAAWNEKFGRMSKGTAVRTSSSTSSRRVRGSSPARPRRSMRSTAPENRRVALTAVVPPRRGDRGTQEPGMSALDPCLYRSPSSSRPRRRA